MSLAIGSASGTLQPFIARVLMPVPAVRPLIAGNWKMNGLKDSVAELDAMLKGAAELPQGIDLLVCPPATLVASFAARVAEAQAGKALPFSIGGQDCHANASGAHTGDIAAEMLADAGAAAIIVGHSERRADHAENDAIVRAKAQAVWRAGLVAIVCVGETQGERDAGHTLDVVAGMLAGSLPDGATAANLVVAYEPVWAIGTGRTPTAADVEEVHGFIRKTLSDRFGAAGETMRILYGGSVKPSNARELLAVPHVNGALIGGASLKASDFLAIAAGCP
uniref:Triosephosphate isomerase n=2 Tax=Rhodopseudomonas palustris (strain ATCC BAA-98 / CGA009) TaxID=258594 RepID=Q6N5T2_RHOPA|nr:triose-phosphate isomerase [Rhodopseudomonas palustris CGA009]